MVSTVRSGNERTRVWVAYDTRGRKTAVDDPDLGYWQYAYNGFGDLISQDDPQHPAANLTYDQMGRLRFRDDAAGRTEWLYDSAPGAGIGKLAAIISAPDSSLLGPCEIPAGSALTDGYRTVKSFSYDGFGQIVNTSHCIDGLSHDVTNAYDTLHRLSSLTYPVVEGSRLVVNYSYTQLGYLHYLSDAAGNTYWRAKSMDVTGQVTSQTTGNGVETTTAVNQATGWMLGRTALAHADGETTIQGWSYSFNEVGNLLTRTRADDLNAAPSQETFTYDLLDRLKTAQVQIGGTNPYDANNAYSYDDLGNLTQKDQAAYSYTGCMAGSRTAGPHAVCDAGAGEVYQYDEAGNMIAGRGRTIEYNPSNKVTHITSAPDPSQGNDSGQVYFIYDGDGNRVVQYVTDLNGSQIEDTTYVGMGATGRSVYELTRRGSTTEHVHHIYAGSANGGAPLAVRIVKQESGTTTLTSETRYYHTDHLGSVTAVSDEVGHVVSAAWGGVNATNMGYDAWGAQRSPDGRAESVNAFETARMRNL